MGAKTEARKREKCQEGIGCRLDVYYLNQEGVKPYEENLKIPECHKRRLEKIDSPCYWIGQVHITAKFNEFNVGTQ